VAPARQSGAGAEIRARPPNQMMITLLSIVLIIASLMLMVLVLLHRGKGGGLSSMFGGSLYSSLSGSSVVERNLDRLTVIAGLVWSICIIGLGLLYKAS
jgi:preprotein translocase subunit SecG